MYKYTQIDLDKSRFKQHIKSFVTIIHNFLSYIDKIQNGPWNIVKTPNFGYGPYFGRGF